MTFDSTKPLAMAQFRTVAGYDLQPGAPLTIVDEPAAAGEVDEALAKRLWLSGIAIYANDFRPTPVESREEEALRLVEMEDVGSGWYTIRAPWLRKPIRARGKVKADKEYRKVVEAGRVEEPEPEAGQVEEPETNPNPLVGSGEVIEPPHSPAVVDTGKTGEETDPPLAPGE